MTANQTTITGPKTRPITWVPKRWIAKRATSTAIVYRHHQRLRLGTATFTPSTAERTEIAGVMIPSP